MATSILSFSPNFVPQAVQMYMENKCNFTNDTRAEQKVFSLSNKTPKISIKNHFIAFQNIRLDDLYTCAYAQTNFRSTFASPKLIAPKHEI